MIHFILPADPKRYLGLLKDGPRIIGRIDGADYRVEYLSDSHEYIVYVTGHRGDNHIYYADVVEYMVMKDIKD